LHIDFSATEDQEHGLHRKFGSNVFNHKQKKEILRSLLTLLEYITPHVVMSLITCPFHTTNTEK